MADYDIFISCKSEDYEIAEKVYSFLKDNGFSVFLSSKELRRMAQADYMDAISVALDTAYSMIVISTKKEYLTSKWVKFEWSTFLNEILSGRKTGQIMTMLDKIGVSEMPIQLRKYESFTLENYEEILPYLEKPKKPEEPHKSGSAEVHIETDIACRVMRFNEELITAQPGIDNLINLKKGTHQLTFISLENEQDSYSQVYTVKDDCEFLQVSLAQIQATRLAKEEAERLAKEEAERKRIAEDDAKYLSYINNGKYGFIKDGVVILQAKYDQVWAFRDGLAQVELNRKYGYIDKNGNEVIPIKYDSVLWDLGVGVALVELNGKWGYIAPSGKKVTPIKYDHIWAFFEGCGLAQVELNRKYGYIDKNGNEVIPIKYDSVSWDSGVGLAQVELNGKFGLIDKIGKEVIPIKYDKIWAFCEGLASVALNGKWGYIDPNGKEVIAFKYDYAYDFSDGLAVVVLNGKCGYIDKSGNTIIPFKYDDARNFSEGLAMVKCKGIFSLKDKWGYIDKSGKEVIPIKYDDAKDFQNGKALVKLNGKQGIIDKQGNFTPN